jgi:hypothetical protein
MINFKTVTAALALGVAVAAAATPALAKHRVIPRGHAARAQAIPDDVGDGAMSGHRAVAIRECCVRAAPFSQTTWGNVSSDQYRACMAEHGEME